MDIPDLVQRALGGEEIQAGVSLGDDDAVCFTPTRTLVYKGEGLISDEGVEEFPLDVERLAVKRSRRKTKFQLQYIEGPRSFTVPSNRGEDVLERLLEGVFRVESVVEPDESVLGVYLFSELTLVVADRRLVKHVGEAVWDDDYEVYDFDDVTGLDFERTSVATSIVVEIDGYPQRVKVPSDTGPVVRKTLQDALFDFHGVGSLEELNRVLGPDDDEPETDADAPDQTDDLALGSGIDPLVTDSDSDPARGVEDPFAAGSEEDGGADEGSPLAEPALDPANDDGTDADPDAVTADAPASEDATVTDESADDDPLSPTGASVTHGNHETDSGSTSEKPATDAVTADETGGQSETDDETGEQNETTDGSAPDESAVEPGNGAAAAEAVATRDDIEVVADRLEELTDAVDRQNELLKRQHRAMKQLVERLDDE
jgi:hypothetical protein